MNRMRCRGVWGGIALAIALGGCAAGAATSEPTYFEASAADPARPAGFARPNYTSSSARYAAGVGGVLGSDAPVHDVAPALDDLANAVAGLPGAPNGRSAETIRLHARQLRNEENDPVAARRDLGLALAAAANAFDGAARVLYPRDATLARAVAELWNGIYLVANDEMQIDRTDVHAALVAMDNVLRAYAAATAAAVD